MFDNCERKCKRLLRAYEENKENGYIIGFIDFERCLGQKIGDYQVEVSGLNVNGNRKFDVHVYIWKNHRIIYRFTIREHAKGYATYSKHEMYFDTKDECFSALKDALLKVKQQLEEKVKNDKSTEIV